MSDFAEVVIQDAAAVAVNSFEGKRDLFFAFSVIRGINTEIFIDSASNIIICTGNPRVKLSEFQYDDNNTVAINDKNGKVSTN